MATVEAITSVERRRRWSRDEKLRIIAESARPDRTASQVARAHGDFRLTDVHGEIIKGIL